MAHDDEHGQHERIFTLVEANRLIPQLNSKLTSIQQAKAILSRTKEDIKKASAQAEYGGGSSVRDPQIDCLQQLVSKPLVDQDLRIRGDDVDAGSLDFDLPHDGRIV